jgi:hypothetical protein
MNNTKKQIEKYILEHINDVEKQKIINEFMGRLQNKMMSIKTAETPMSVAQDIDKTVDVNVIKQKYGDKFVKKIIDLYLSRAEVEESEKKKWEEEVRRQLANRKKLWGESEGV